MSIPEQPVLRKVSWSHKVIKRKQASPHNDSNRNGNIQTRVVLVTDIQDFIVADTKTQP